MASPSPSAPPSLTAQNFVSLSQDIAALLSLSIEATASLVHDVYRRALSTIGLEQSVTHRESSKGRVGGEAGRGLAVVVLGATERESPLYTFSVVDLTR